MVRRKQPGMVLVCLHAFGHRSPPRRRLARRAVSDALYSRNGSPTGKSIDEAIPQTDHRLDLAARGFQLAAQAPDVHVDGACLDQPFVAPDPLEEPIARDHAILVLNQILQQLELAARQTYRRAIDGDGDGVEIGAEPLAAIERR